ncbi:MAG TPA: hypothetical protein VJ865_02710 [Gemmatimonadaceae bacterium]|nr:hypothetical protein [Gemmatimonadaceae bacterium]
MNTDFATMTHSAFEEPVNLSQNGARRVTPRSSLIVVLPENHAISPDGLAQHLPRGGSRDIDVIVACAGQPVNLHSLQRTVADAQFLLAPAGTSMEDLRELAMQQAPGDIVTLVSGALLMGSGQSQAEILKSS